MKQSGTTTTKKVDLAIRPLQNSKLNWLKIKKEGYPNLSYFNSIRSMTRFRIAWLRYKHPEWELDKVTADILNWYAKEVPQGVRRDMKKFMRQEWENKCWLKINAVSFEVIFGEKVEV